MAEKERQSRTLNYVRASISHGRGRKALDEIRQDSSVASFKGIITVAYRVPNTGKYPLLAEQVRNPKWLLSFKAFERLPFFPELEWSICQIERWSSQLTSYLNAKEGIQLNLLAGQWEDAKLALAEHEQSWGLSGWLIAAKTAVLQWSVGQEAQKEYAGEVIRLYRGLPVAIAHLCSQRNEDAVSLGGFLARASDTIQDWHLRAEWEKFLRWMTTGSAPENLEDASDLMRVAASGSILDLYEATVAAMEFAMEMRSSLSTREVQYLSQAVNRLSGMTDPRIEAMGGALRENQDVSATRASAVRFQEILTCARQQVVPAALPVLAKLLEALQGVTNRGEGAEEKRLAALKLGLAFDFLPIGDVVSAFAVAVADRGAFAYEETRKSIIAGLGHAGGTIWSGEPGTREYLLSTLEGLVAAGSPDAGDLLATLDLGDQFERVLSAKSRYELALTAGDWWAAVCVAVECLLDLPGAAREFALAENLGAKSWSELKAHAGKLELAIGLSYSLRGASSEASRQKIHRHLQQAALRILHTRGVSHFSDLIRAFTPDAALQCFLREACIESVMEVNTNIRSSRALSEERMKICQELSVIDEQNATRYLDEIKQITFGLELEDGVRHFDSSRLFVNTDGLTKWASTALAEDFSRYISLRSSALPDVAEIQAALLTVQMNDKNTPIPAVLLEQPKTEAERLLSEMVQRLSREFYSNPVFGLNSFLSLRIRHGSLAGHLRGPLEELAVIASRAEDGGYLPIERWAGLKNDLPEGAQRQFDAIFETFSARFDAKIGRVVDELLQIRSEVKPRGAFEDSVSLVLINALKGSLSDSASLPQVIEVCLANFKVSLEPTLERIRFEIGEYLKNELDQLLQEVMVDLEVLSTGPEMIAVMDAMGRARTNLALAVDRVAQWFTPLDREASDRTYSIEQIMRMGEKLTTNARPMFQPNLNLEIDGELPLFGAQSGAFLIADALFIVFDNVYLHSGLESPIDIAIKVSITKEGFIAFRIENDVAHPSNLDEKRANLDRIRAQLDSGEFRKRVAGEGGTGFFKLRRLGEAAAFEGRSNIEFDMTEEKFIVDLRVPLLVREVYEEMMNETPNS